MSVQTVALIFGISYLIGSFPTAYLICRLHGINIFEVGSGNMGANNTARALGIQWGVVVWVFDGLKGLLAMLIARYIVAPDDASAAMLISAVAVVFGHNWSLFATLMTGRIRGGKGAATASGTWILLAPPALFPVVIMLWAVIVALTRYMSLAVLTSVALASIIIILVRGDDPIYILYILVPLMVFYRHRENIKAILAGKERRFGEKI
ncbi:MAG: acyl-phosphate glycerol 3-phosphate acyltransferase [Phototrophicales bacterium]|nr:MAG: acyl-phosphate glycerol 3-phosphate acyltransferase [Phototrophicales bacterium]